MQLVQTSQKPLAQIARDLGIADSTLHHWRKLFSEQWEQAFPGSGHQTPQEEEIRRLKRENELLRITTANERGYTGREKDPNVRTESLLSTHPNIAKKMFPGIVMHHSMLLLDEEARRGK